MAKNSNVTYTTLNITSGPVKTAMDAVTKAEEAFQAAAMAAATKAKLIPDGMYGKVVRNRFGGGWQLAISPTPFGVGGSSAAASI